MYTIGVDIGGMSVKLGIVDAEGHILKQNRFKSNGDYKNIIDNIVIHINKLIEECSISIEQISGIGIGCPGAVNSETGVVDFLPNMGWEKVELVKLLKEHFDLKIKISNDANVAALGEARFGCAKNYNSSIMFTLGTGVGGGIIIDKKLFEGNLSKGAELGHVTLILDGEKCSCGRTGCIECYTSATALIKQTKKAMNEDLKSIMWDFVENDINKVDGRTAFECAKKGDKTANMVVDKYIYYLAESILSMLNIFRPEAFIIGGGISAQGEYLTEKLKEYCLKAEFGYKGAPSTDILVATLGNDAGIIGAASLID